MLFHPRQGEWERMGFVRGGIVLDTPVYVCVYVPYCAELTAVIISPALSRGLQHRIPNPPSCLTVINVLLLDFPPFLCLCIPAHATWRRKWIRIPKRGRIRNDEVDAAARRHKATRLHVSSDP